MNQSELLKTFIVPMFFPILSIIDGMVISFARFFPRKPTTNGVIFIRTDNLGDFILWLAAASALRQHWPWPGHRFVLIANVEWAELARSLQLFDDVIPINRKKFQRHPGYRFASLFQLARLRAELLINPINSRDPLSADTVARAVDANRKLAARGDASEAYGQEERANRWYHNLIDSGDVNVHEALKNRDFLVRLCNIELTDPWPKISVADVENKPIELPKCGYAVIAAGAPNQRKMWLPEYFAQVASKLVTQTALQVVLVGTRSESPQVNEVDRRCPAQLLNLVGELNLSGLMHVLKNAQLIVTNDTGAAHLGAAFRVPTVCIAGGGQFTRFVPYPAEAARAGIKFFTVNHEMPCYGCNWRCIYPTKRGHPVPCVSRVNVDSVWRMVQFAIDHAPTVSV